MIRRATMGDIAAINKWCGADFGEFIVNKLNVVLIEGEGCAMFAWRGPGIYEAHSNLAQRGKAAFDTAHRMFSHMRENHEVSLFWTAVPIGSRKVIMFARRLGWKSRGVTQFPHGACEIFAKDNSCHI